MDGFKFDRKIIEKLFSGKQVTIKICDDQETANKYRAAFKKAGAICSIIENPIPSRPPKFEPVKNPFDDFTESPAPELRLNNDEQTTPKLELDMEPFKQSQSGFSCPKCGFVQDKARECVSCGIIFNKFYHGQQKELNSADQLTGRSNQRTRVHHKTSINSSSGTLGFIVTRVFNRRFLLVLALVTFIIVGIAGKKDHHILYDVKIISLACGDLARQSKHYNDDNGILGTRYLTDYSYLQREESERIKNTKGEKFCVYQYSITLGNVGREEVVSVDFKFSPTLFRGLALDDKAMTHLKHRILNISASNPREHDPEIKPIDQSHLKILGISQGTLIRLDLIAWFQPDEDPIMWDKLLDGVTISQGTIEIGNPRRTTFFRMFMP